MDCQAQGWSIQKLSALSSRYLVDKDKLIDDLATALIAKNKGRIPEICEAHVMRVAILGAFMEKRDITTVYDEKLIEPDDVKFMERVVELSTLAVITAFKFGEAVGGDE